MNQLAYLLLWLIQALSLLIVARALLSWFIRDTTHPVMRILLDLTEPVLRPIRRMMPSDVMVDFSPLIAIVALQILGGLIAGLMGA